jgi:hypothetical protein
MAQQQLRRRIKTGVPPGTANIAFQVLLAAEGTSDMAQTYLAEQASLDDDSRRDCLQSLVAKYEAMTPEQRRGAAETAGTGTKKMAVRWLKEHSLADWLKQQNTTKKITPSSTQVWREFAGARGVDEPDVVPEKRKHKLQWVKRWAQRHNIRRGKFSVGSAVPRDQAVQKATESSMQSVHLCNRFQHIFGPSGALLGAQYEVHNADSLSVTWC